MRRRAHGRALYVPGVERDGERTCEEVGVFHVQRSEVRREQGTLAPFKWVCAPHAEGCPGPRRSCLKRQNVTSWAFVFS